MFSRSPVQVLKASDEYKSLISSPFGEFDFHFLIFTACFINRENERRFLHNDNLSPIYTTSEEFENGGFTLKNALNITH